MGRSEGSEQLGHRQPVDRDLALHGEVGVGDVASLSGDEAEVEAEPVTVASA